MLQVANAGMPVKIARNIRSSEITSESIYLDRRRFLERAGLGVAAGAVASVLPRMGDAAIKDLNTVPGPYSTDETPNSWEDITTYNNFYELGTGKEDPYRNAQDFQPLPWSVRVSGECDKPGDYTYEDIIRPHTLEDRVYRHRCVEAWSMVVPWVGFPLGDLLKRFQPNSNAKFVRFQTLHDPKRMPG